MLADQLMNDSPSFQRVLYLDDINDATKDDLVRTKAIVVDYGQSDINVLNALLEVKIVISRAILFLSPAMSATKARLIIF